MTVSAELLCRNPQVNWAHVDDEIVVFDPKTMGVHRLQGGSVVIWDLLAIPRTRDSLIAEILSATGRQESALVSEISLAIDLMAKQLLLDTV